MNDRSLWQRNNDAYLAAALDWLRLRLLRQIAALERAPDSSPISRAVVSDAELAEAEAAVAKAEAVEPPPALVILRDRLGLSRFECDVLLLCTGLELDTRIATLCAHAQDDPLRPYPTFALALALFDEAHWEALSPYCPLRYWRLIEINQPGAQPLAMSALRADERIVNFVKGLNQLDDRLAPLLIAMSADGAALPYSQQAVVDMVIGQFDDPRHDRPVVQLVGPDKSSKQLIASDAAARLDLFLYRLSPELLPAHAGELETFARLWNRESRLLPLALYLDAHEIDAAGANESPARLIHRFLGRCRGVVFLDTRDVWPELNESAMAIDVGKPTPSEQQSLWSAALGDASGDSPLRLAAQFSLSLSAIQQIAGAAQRQATNGDLPDCLWQACLAHTRPRLDALAQRIDPRATWDDLVLPETELNLLRQIVAQVRQRGRVYDDWGFRQ